MREKVAARLRITLVRPSGRNRVLFERGCSTDEYRQPGQIARCAGIISTVPLHERTERVGPGATVDQLSSTRAQIWAVLEAGERHRHTHSGTTGVRLGRRALLVSSNLSAGVQPIRRWACLLLVRGRDAAALLHSSELTSDIDMDVELVPITLFIAFFGSIAYIAKVIGDTRIRRKVLEARVSEGVADAILNRGWQEPSTRSALKWGLVIVALGLGILLVDLFAISFESPLAYAVLLLATGVALLGYYFIERDNPEAFNGQSDGSPSQQKRSAAESVHDPEL